MEAGADIASVSMHKSGGSLTQSSFLLTGKGVNPGYIRQIINLTQTTSGSYLLLVQPGYLQAESGSERRTVLPGSDFACRLCAGGDQPDRRLLCFRQEMINRGQHL